jgi:hypothetical protein
MTHRGKWLFSLLAALVLSGSSACAMLTTPGLTAPRDFVQEQPQATAPDPFQAPGQDLPPDQFPDLQPQPLVFVPASCVIADTPPQPGDILLAPDALGRMWFLRVEYEEVHNGEFCYALSPLGLCGESIGGAALRGFGESLWNDGLNNMGQGASAIFNSPYNAIAGTAAYLGRLTDDPSGTLNGTFNNPNNAIQNASWNSVANYMSDPSAVALSVWGGGTMALGLSPGAAADDVFAVTTPQMTKVTSWAGGGSTPDLNPGRWVQLGDATTANFWLTGLPGPKAYLQSEMPFLSVEGPKGPFTPITGTVPTSSLQWPQGWESWKGILGQRQITQP